MTQSSLVSTLRARYADLRTALGLPRVTINLMHDRSRDNDPFFGRITAAVHREYTRRHPRLPLIRFLEYGVALCRLPADHDSWWRALEGSARRNVRKALRLGYEVRPLDFNSQLDAITAIHRSTEVRQGPMDPSLLVAAQPIADPSSRDTCHDYFYLAVYRDDLPVAYVGCMVAGEAMMIHALYGHADYQKDGIVPLLVSGVAERAIATYPDVRYLVYDKWFGASPTLRRFKGKLNFAPYRVRWVLA